jgi:hypothetical protein
VSDFDTEMAFVRALSVHGMKLAGDISNEDRCERIRVAILSQALADKKFTHGPLRTMETYREAFERCYHRSLDMRRRQRDPTGRPITPEPIPLLDEEYGTEEDEDEKE